MSREYLNPINLPQPVFGADISCSGEGNSLFHVDEYGFYFLSGTDANRQILPTQHLNNTTLFRDVGEDGVLVILGTDEHIVAPGQNARITENRKITLIRANSHEGITYNGELAIFITPEEMMEKLL